MLALSKVYLLRLRHNRQGTFCMIDVGIHYMNRLANANIRIDRIQVYPDGPNQCPSLSRSTSSIPNEEHHANFRVTPYSRQGRSFDSDLAR